MLSFLFWNLNGNNPVDRSEIMRNRIARLAKHFDIDVFIFVESNFEPEELADALCGINVGRYWHSQTVCQRIQIFSRLPVENVKPQYDSVDDRMTIRQLEVPPHKILIAAVHLPSQLHQEAIAIGFQATTMRNEIATVERSLDNYHTILVGDMNMNPFDEGMVAAQAFHGVMTKRLAKPKRRVISGIPYRFFYNPMWGLFGDRSSADDQQRPSGTSFYSSGSSIEYFWQMHDQVLLRPELMETLDELKFLENDGEVSFLNRNGRPNRKTASDHLPILFRLQLGVLENKNEQDRRSRSVV